MVRESPDQVEHFVHAAIALPDADHLPRAFPKQLGAAHRVELVDFNSLVGAGCPLGFLLNLGFPISDGQGIPFLAVIREQCLLINPIHITEVCFPILGSFEHALDAVPLYKDAAADILFHQILFRERRFVIGDALPARGHISPLCRFLPPDQDGGVAGSRCVKSDDMRHQCRLQLLGGRSGRPLNSEQQVIQVQPRGVPRRLAFRPFRPAVFPVPSSCGSHALVKCDRSGVAGCGGAEIFDGFDFHRLLGQGALVFDLFQCRHQHFQVHGLVILCPRWLDQRKSKSRANHATEGTHFHNKKGENEPPNGAKFARKVKRGIKYFPTAIFPPKRRSLPCARRNRLSGPGQFCRPRNISLRDGKNTTR